jgi:hypothetical protein
MNTKLTLVWKLLFIVCLCLLAAYTVNAHAAQAQMPTDDLPSPDCKIDLQNLDEVVHKSLSGQLDSMYCMSQRLYDHYWNAAPPPVTDIQRKYAPKGKPVRHYARFYFRDYKILSSKDIAPIDGKPARSYQVKVLYVLMQFADTGEEKPLCETATYTVKFAKEPWGWHEVPGVWSGTNWQAVVQILKQDASLDGRYAIKSTDSEKLARDKKRNFDRSNELLKLFANFSEQCNKTL